MRLPPRPKLSWKAHSTPVDSRVGDVYYSDSNGLAESRAVFLTGCCLPDRWLGRDRFTVAELGFGTGLNFLALWQMWQATRGETGWLNFVSFEGYLLDRADVERALSAWTDIANLSQKLIENWPVRAKGVQRVVWPKERLSLTLHIGSIKQTLARSQFKADAWFLDGFSPAKNPEMWEESLWPLVAERSAPGVRLATFTVAGAVRRGLQDAGFSVVKRPGYDRKRQRLEGMLSEVKPPLHGQSGTCRVAIIGAGIAGATLAQAFVERGADVHVFDKAEGSGQGTSGNPLALVMPRLDAGDTVEARLLIDAYVRAQAAYRDLPGVDSVAVIQRPRDGKEMSRFAKILADPPLGPEQLEALPDGGLLHKAAMVIRPALLLPALLAGAKLCCGRQVVVDVETRTVNEQAFDVILFASGWHLQQALPWLRMQGRLGQVDWVEAEKQMPTSALASGDYALACGRERLWGATFEAYDGGAVQISEIARAQNAAALERLAPSWWQDVGCRQVKSRAGIRATTPDQLPIIGALAKIDEMIEAFTKKQISQAIMADISEHKGLYLAGGFGARGFTWGPWAAAILACEVFADPTPATQEALKAVAPVRQVLRDLRRARL